MKMICKLLWPAFILLRRMCFKSPIDFHLLEAVDEVSMGRRESQADNLAGHLPGTLLFRAQIEPIVVKLLMFATASTQVANYKLPKCQSRDLIHAPPWPKASISQNPKPRKPPKRSCQCWTTSTRLTSSAMDNSTTQNSGSPSPLSRSLQSIAVKCRNFQRIWCSRINSNTTTFIR